MNPSDYGYLTYLVVLTVAVLFWFITNHRESFGKTVQQVLAWVLIFIGVIAAVGMWDDIQNQALSTQAVFEDGTRIEIPLGPDGHYHATLQINGVDVPFVVDTGASDMVLSQEDAARVGLNPDSLAYIGIALTANGEVRTAPVKLDQVDFGHFTDNNVRARVNGGDLDTSLLGMSYLRSFQQITITRNRLVLTR